MSRQYDIIAEIQQSRSEYQLRHFVIGQHDTPEMQFYQCCIELQGMEYNLAAAELTARKLQIKADRKRATGDDLDAVKADLIDLELQQQDLAVIGARREIDALRRILAEMAVYTRAEIEQAQPEYWAQRLVRQTELQRMGAQIGVGWSQLDAMRQADLLSVTPQEIEPGTASLNPARAAEG